MAIYIDPVSIEPMRFSDIQDVVAIEKLCYAVLWPENAYETELSNRSASYFVARINGVAVGYCGMWIIMDEAHITTIAVHPAHQRKKIGERLFHAMMEEVVLRGGDRASLEVRERNFAAQSLYRKYGFREAALRKNYYSDNKEHALVMWIDGMKQPDYQHKLRALKQDLYQAYDQDIRHRDQLR